MLFAEVFSGASLLWFIDPWSILITFPLYLSHVLFFLNLAIRLHRTSFESLYLWGILFGLYETWITKVIWSGFGDELILGQILGIAIGEFIILCLFWHPIMSFITPILVFEIFSLSRENNHQKLLPGHAKLITKSKKNQVLAWLIVLYGASFLSLNSHYNIIVALVTALGSLMIVILLYYACKKYCGEFTVYELKLGFKGFITLIVYLIFLYAMLFFLIYPEKIPSLIIIFITILIYMTTIILIYLSKPLPEKINKNIKEFYTAKDVWKSLLTFTLLTAVFCLIPTIGSIIAILLFILMIPMGITLFFFTLLNIIRYFSKKKQ